MKKQFLKIIDFLIFIFSFLLLLSTYFKLLSITFSNNEDNFIAVETKKDLSRSIDTPKTEQTISGPKDSFTENYNVNIGLIRKRIKSKDLILEEFSIGNLTNTKVGILYMDNSQKVPVYDSKIVRIWRNNL